jgi:hypothetical protein
MTFRKFLRSSRLEGATAFNRKEQTMFKPSNLKSFALGFGIAISALGLYALAATLNTFKAGDVVSAQLINDNFTNLNADVAAASTAAATANTGVTTLNTKVTALEAKKALPSRGTLYGYAYITGPGSATADYSFNPFGTITTTNPSTGNFTVTFAGTTNNNTDTSIRHVQVTAYGANSNFCKVFFFAGPDIKVQCYDTAGALVNNSFNVQISN